jgi:hypothetical protein
MRASWRWRLPTDEGRQTIKTDFGDMWSCLSSSALASWGSCDAHRKGLAQFDIHIQYSELLMTTHPTLVASECIGERLILANGESQPHAEPLCDEGVSAYGAGNSTFRKLHRHAAERERGSPAPRRPLGRRAGAEWAGTSWIAALCVSDESYTYPQFALDPGCPEPFLSTLCVGGTSK